MNIKGLMNISRILGYLLMPFSVTMLPPLFVALWYQEKTLLPFYAATVTTLTLGFLLWFPFRHHKHEIQSREAFLIVVLLWLGLALTGALPFIFFETPRMHYIDAIFETISGLTTTGATILSELDTLPRSILYYRQQLQFIGGGGMIVLSIAILPMLGIGGMQLFRAETAGPFKEDKLTPRIAQTAKMLWLIYVSLTILCALSYWAAGMSAFDAIGHSFSTISTGGFGTHDQNFSEFQSPLLEYLGVIFMLLGAVNFSLHFSAINRGNLLHYWQDSEFKAYIKFWFGMVLLISATLFYFHIFEHKESTLTKAFFQVTSFITTTGFFSARFNEWPTFVPVLLIFLGLLGGCAGSTAGGIKMIRLLILKKQSAREIQRLIHPNGHYIIKLGDRLLHDRTLDAILGFFCIFVAIFVVLLLVLIGMGLDPLSAFATLAASISNTGIGLNYPSDNFKSLSDSIKMVLSIGMLAGRLELFTLLVLLTPHYWRH